MTGTICILGAGELGGAIAHALARRGCVSRIVLIDAGSIAAGKALDIQQSGAIEGFHTALSGTTDDTRVAGSLACVVADRAGRPDVEWQGEEGLSMLRRLATYIGDAPVVFAGATHASLLTAAARETGIRRQRLIGSAPEAFAAAVRAIVALDVRCSPSEVLLTVLGTPPAGFVVPWSEASIGGYALERVVTPPQLTRLEARVAKLWPPGPFALGLAAARAIEALTISSRRALSVLSVLDGELGLRDRVGTLPALLAPEGIVHLRVPTLNTRERVLLETALGS